MTTWTTGVTIMYALVLMWSLLTLTVTAEETAGTTFNSSETNSATTDQYYTDTINGSDTVTTPEQDHSRSLFIYLVVIGSLCGIAVVLIMVTLSLCIYVRRVKRRQRTRIQTIGAVESNKPDNKEIVIVMQQPPKSLSDHNTSDDVYESPSGTAPEQDVQKDDDDDDDDDLYEASSPPPCGNTYQNDRFHEAFKVTANTVSEQTFQHDRDDHMYEESSKSPSPDTSQDVIYEAPYRKLPMAHIKEDTDDIIYEERSIIPRVHFKDEAEEIIYE